MKRVDALHIGIANLEQMKARTLAIARGDYRPRPDEPKVWFLSLESVAKTLSEGNRELLRVVATKRPRSLEELASLTGRRKSNVSRTLHTMERYGIVQLRRGERGRIAPTVQHEHFIVQFSLPNAPK